MITHNMIFLIIKLSRLKIYSYLKLFLSNVFGGYSGELSVSVDTSYVEPNIRHD